MKSQFLVLPKRQISRTHEMACSVSENNNSTASLRAKQLQQSFQRSC